jgi:predicted regulator of Ras-like GTPase activity (Roadblock/LC7/MglB family)
MEEILQKINAMQGVLGSLILDGEGNALSAAMPDTIEETILYDVGRTITQTLGGLSTIHRRKVGDIDLVFHHGRFIIKNLGERYLCILCISNVNASLLDLSISAVKKKIMEKAGVSGRQGIQESRKRTEEDSHFRLVSNEVASIISIAHERGIVLQAAGDTAISLHCPSAVHPTALLERNLLQLVGREKQTAQITQLLSDLGYSRERTLGVLRSGQCLRFVHPEKKFSLEVFLDVQKMRYQLDFSERLSLYDDFLPLADLLLWKLQTSPFDEQAACSVYAILNDHELGGPGEPEKVDVSRIIGICTSDWGWYKLVTADLEKSIDWVNEKFGDETVVFLERATHLLQMIKDAPKSDGWQLRGLFDEEPLI